MCEGAGVGRAGLKQNCKVEEGEVFSGLFSLLSIPKSLNCLFFSLSDVVLRKRSDEFVQTQV